MSLHVLIPQSIVSAKCIAARRLALGNVASGSSDAQAQRRHRRSFISHSPPFTMAAAEGDQFLKQASGRNTRGLLRVIILALIAGAAVSSRLFSVIRFESIIHECTLYPSRRNAEGAIWLIQFAVDPWFNFRATKYLVQNGFYSFWDWFDDRTCLRRNPNTPLHTIS